MTSEKRLPIHTRWRLILPAQLGGFNEGVA